MFKYLNEYSIPESDKQKLIQKYLSPTAPRNALSSRIQATKQLTGSNVGHSAMRKELIDIYNDITNNIDSSDNNEENIQKISTNLKPKSFHSIVEFSSSVYVGRAVNDNEETTENKCTVTLVRKNNIAEDLHVT
jgi:hypothetical protein